jgi:hypothetical protein
MMPDTFFFILTGLHGRQATDRIIADMTKEQPIGKEVKQLEYLDGPEGQSAVQGQG